MGLSEAKINLVVNVIVHDIDYTAWQAGLSAEDYARFVAWLTKFIEHPTCPTVSQLA
jgi:hypothetical protein